MTGAEALHQRPMEKETSCINSRAILDYIRVCESCSTTSRDHGLDNEEFLFCGKCGQETIFAIAKLK